MERITRSDLDHALEAHVRALDACGITYDGRLVIDHGSKTYGRAYRLYHIASGETGHRNPPVGGDYLGMTAREAYDNLTTRNSVLFDVAYLRGIGS